MILYKPLLIVAFIICLLFIATVGCANMPIINGYVPNWSIYNNTPISSFNTTATKLNTVTYAFMYINSKGAIVSSDSYADITKKQLEQFSQLPVQNKLLSIGGGGYTGWTPALSNPTNFVNSLAQYVTKYNINGIDFDYEPSLSSYNTTAQRMIALVKAVRAKYPDFIITYTVQSGVVGTNKIKGVGPKFWKILSDNNVYVQIMNYDFFGTWESRTMLHSGLYYAEMAVTALNANGIDSSRIVLGVPLYGVQVTRTTQDGLGSRFSTRGSSMPTYSSIISRNLNIIDVPYGNYIAGSYANDSKGNFVAFDSVNSVKSKSQWILDMGLGGIMMWEITNDVPIDNPQSLINAIWEMLNE